MTGRPVCQCIVRLNMFGGTCKEELQTSQILPISYHVQANQPRWYDEAPHLLSLQEKAKDYSGPVTICNT